MDGRPENKPLLFWIINSIRPAQNPLKYNGLATVHQGRGPLGRAKALSEKTFTWKPSKNLLKDLVSSWESVMIPLQAVKPSSFATTVKNQWEYRCFRKLVRPNEGIIRKRCFWDHCPPGVFKRGRIQDSLGQDFSDSSWFPARKNQET